MDNFLFCSQHTMIDSTDISNILNTFLLILVANSVQQIQSVQSHKKYDFFVHPTLQPSFIFNVALSKHYFQQLKLMFEKITNILGDKISKVNLVYCFLEIEYQLKEKIYFHQYQSCPSNTEKTLLINSESVICTLSFLLFK